MSPIKGWEFATVYFLGVLTGLFLVVLFDVAAGWNARRKARRK